MERASGVLRDLFGKIRVEPRGDVLVDKVATTGAGLLGSRPASINTSIVVAGVRSQRYQALVTALDILVSGPRSKSVKTLPSAP